MLTRQVTLTDPEGPCWPSRSERKRGGREREDKHQRFKQRDALRKDASHLGSASYFYRKIRSLRPWFRSAYSRVVHKRVDCKNVLDNGEVCGSLGKILVTFLPDWQDNKVDVS